MLVYFHQVLFVMTTPGILSHYLRRRFHVSVAVIGPRISILHTVCADIAELLKSKEIQKQIDRNISHKRTVTRFDGCINVFLRH
jgi:hypothetical protein